MHVCVPGRSNYRFVCISTRIWLIIYVLSKTSARARARAVGRLTPTSAIVPTMAELRYRTVVDRTVFLMTRHFHTTFSLAPRTCAHTLMLVWFHADARLLLTDYTRYFTRLSEEGCFKST